ncbi:MAG: hypothetical protein ACK56I_31240, partial [bacterium]
FISRFINKIIGVEIYYEMKNEKYKNNFIKGLFHWCHFMRIIWVLFQDLLFLQLLAILVIQFYQVPPLFILTNLLIVF